MSKDLYPSFRTGPPLPFWLVLRVTIQPSMLRSAATSLLLVQWLRDASKDKSEFYLEITELKRNLTYFSVLLSGWIRENALVWTIPNFCVSLHRTDIIIAVTFMLEIFCITLSYKWPKKRIFFSKLFSFKNS